MDRGTLRQHLAQAQHHVAEAKRHVDRQEELIVQLERDGHDTSEAVKVLATMRATQALHEQNVARLLAELTR
jgi:hypothetical protein